MASDASANFNIELLKKLDTIAKDEDEKVFHEI